MKSYAKKLVRSALRRTGYEISRLSNRPNLYDFEEDAKIHIDLVRDNTMVAYEGLVTLWQQVWHCEISETAGCYVECGVWKGGSVGLMALANQFYGTRRRHIHLFDAFDDICEPDPTVDGEKAVAEVERLANVARDKLSGKLTPLVGIYKTRGGPGIVEEVAHFLESTLEYDGSFLHYHKGWFQETLPEAAVDIGDIAILRVDGDWYASTMICLESLYDNVIQGGFVIIDDYGCYEGCRKAVDEFRRKRGIAAFMNHVNGDCRYWIKT